jgi:hypothetical protein
MEYDYFDYVRDAEFYIRKALEQAMLFKSQKYIDRLKTAHNILVELIKEGTDSDAQTWS